MPGVAALIGLRRLRGQPPFKAQLSLVVLVAQGLSPNRPVALSGGTDSGLVGALPLAGAWRGAVDLLRRPRRSELFRALRARHREQRSPVSVAGRFSFSCPAGDIVPAILASLGAVLGRHLAVRRRWERASALATLCRSRGLQWNPTPEPLVVAAAHAARLGWALAFGHLTGSVVHVELLNSSSTPPDGCSRRGGSLVMHTHAT